MSSRLSMNFILWSLKSTKENVFSSRFFYCVQMSCFPFEIKRSLFCDTQNLVLWNSNIVKVYRDSWSVTANGSHFIIVKTTDLHHNLRLRQTFLQSFAFLLDLVWTQIHTLTSGKTTDKLPVSVLGFLNKSSSERNTGIGSVTALISGRKPNCCWQR